MLVDEKSVLRSLDQGEIVPFYQPFRELRTGRLLGFELLARWENPGEGLILPSVFLPVAEDAGLLTRMTKQVLAQAFQHTRELPEPMTLAVNISPRQLRDEEIPFQIYQVAVESQFPLNRLTVEITETALIDNLYLAQSITQKLKGMGCKILLDDFGTGYSSLAHLQTLHFDGLKIDRSFISGITKTREDRKIVAALIGLGQNLGITTIAEGIETEEQARLLLYMGCEIGQGYFYGRPQPASELRTVMSIAPPNVSPSSGLRGGELNLSNLESLPLERVAQLQAIYDGAPVGLCYLNKDLRFVSANRRLSEIDNTPILSMLGRSVASVFPELFPLYEPYLRRALNGESLRDLELTRPSRHGNSPDQCILFSCEPARDEAGEIIGISIAVLDITERKQEEKKLTESELRFRTLLDLNPQTPWIMDGAGNILDFGSKWESLTGYRREELLRHGYLSTLLEEDQERVMRITEHALKTGTPIDYECRARRFDGTYFWIRVRGKAVLDSEGKVWRFYGSTEDIDELKRLRELADRTRTQG